METILAGVKAFVLETGLNDLNLILLRLKCDGAREETRFRLSAKRTSPFKSAGLDVSSVDYWQPSCAHQR